MFVGTREDVLVKVSVEFYMLLDRLKVHYQQPQFDIGLDEFEKVETYLKARLTEHDPSLAVLNSRKTAPR